MVQGAETRQQENGTWGLDFPAELLTHLQDAERHVTGRIRNLTDMMRKANKTKAAAKAKARRWMLRAAKNSTARDEDLSIKIQQLDAVVSSARKSFKVAEAARAKLSKRERAEAAARAVAKEAARARGKVAKADLEKAAKSLAAVRMYVDSVAPELPQQPKVVVTRKPENWAQASKDLARKLHLDNFVAGKADFKNPWRPTEVDTAFKTEQAFRWQTWPSVASAPEWKKAVEEARASKKEWQLRKAKSKELDALKKSIRENKEKEEALEKKRLAARQKKLWKLQKEKEMHIRKIPDSFAAKLPDFSEPVSNKTKDERAEFKKLFKHGMDAARDQELRNPEAHVRFQDQYQRFKKLLDQKTAADAAENAAAGAAKL